MSSNHRSKRELITIDDDDSSSGQPAVKSEKKEAGPLPASEIFELQRKVIELLETNTKLEKNFQGVCRIAGEAQARVQFLEKLVDTKPKVVNGANNKEREGELETKVNDLTNQLEEERMIIRAKEKREAELQNTVTDLTNELEELRLKYRSKKDRKNELKKEVIDLTNQLEEERMKHQMTKYRAEIKIEGLSRLSAVSLHENAHPTNILQLCRAGTPETISVVEACSRLKTTIKEHGQHVVFNNLRNRCKAGNCEDLECEVCNMKVRSSDVLLHFMSKAHYNQVPCGATVSLAAFERWSLLLDEAAAYAAQQADAATKEIEKEVINLE